MPSRFLKNIALSAAIIAVAGGLCFASARADDAQKPMTKEQVEQIVHDYLMNNGQVILSSVDDYQHKTQAAHQSAAMAQHKDAVMNDTGSPETGNPKGDVTVVEFFDYNCGYCKHAFPGVKELIEKDKGLRFVFKDFPILGPTSETAAKWALAAQKQGKYFEFHKIMMDNKQPITDDLLAANAKSVGLNVDQIKKDIDSPDVMAQITKNRQLATDLDITGTPAFVVGDQIFPGAIPLEELESKIADQRKAKK